MNARRLTAVAVAGLLALTSCGGDDDDTTEVTEAGDDATAASDAGDDTAVATEAEADGGSDRAEAGGATTEAIGSTEATNASTAPGATANPVASTVSGGSAPATAGPAAGEPVDYASADGSYSVTFPGEPMEQTQEQQLPDGTMLPVTFVLFSRMEEGFVTSVVEYAEGTTTDLQGALDGAIANSGATLVEATDIELDGIPGKQAVATIASGSVEGTLLARFYGSGSRLWQVIYTGAGDRSFGDPAVAAFFDSFQLTEGG